MDKKIGFIGCGNMGKAILGGLIASGQVQPGQIWVYTPSPDKVAALRDQYGINAASSAQEVAQIADIVFGAVKPGIMTKVLGDIASSLNKESLVVSIAACLSGAVCGDHCSPISDTTIMASAGAHCSHVNHVSTQLPYAITAAACSAVCYIITGLAQAVLGSRASLVTSLVLLVVAIVLELAVLSVIRARTRAKTSGDAA